MRTTLHALTAAVTRLFWAGTAHRGHFSWARAYGFTPGL